MQCSGGLKTKQITKKYIFGRGKAQSAYYRYDARKTSKWGQRQLPLQNEKGGGASKEPSIRKQNTKAFLYNTNSLYQSMRKHFENKTQRHFYIT